MRDVFPGNVIPASQLDPVALKYQEMFVPLPNRAPSDPFTNANNNGPLATGKRNMTQYLIKGDHQFGAKTWHSFVMQTICGD